MNWIYDIKTPCYVIIMEKLIRNLEILKGVRERTGCEILLAQKAFSMYRLYPLIGKYLSGTAASGLFEARLGSGEMGGETHVFSPAYTESDFSELVGICGHIVFNSYNQWVKFRTRVPKSVSCGLRVNPEYSTQSRAIYDPCSAGSRLGATLESLKDKDLSGIEGLHFHTLCQQNSDALDSTLGVVTKKFGYLFKQIKWLNFGGGHHITREDYDINLLESCIKRVQELGLRVYLEPGEAVALDAGELVTEVLDIIHSPPDEPDIAIIDASAACHMPDVLEMPYRPHIINSAKPGEKRYNYRLGGNTCLAGDIIGDYSFGEPLKAGDRLRFTDMAVYTMVKNNTFNGIKLPSIAILHGDGTIETVKEFGYNDFRRRL